MTHIDQRFIDLMDELALTMEPNDSELQESFAWIEQEAQKSGRSFYEVAFLTIRIYLAEKKAKDWLNEHLQKA